MKSNRRHKVFADPEPATAMAAVISAAGGLSSLLDENSTSATVATAPNKNTRPAATAAAIAAATATAAMNVEVSDSIRSKENQPLPTKWNEYAQLKLSVRTVMTALIPCSVRCVVLCCHVMQIGFRHCIRNVRSRIAFRSVIACAARVIYNF
jgi:hypothetical protein